jgi:hypothetical protein
MGERHDPYDLYTAERNGSVVAILHGPDATMELREAIVDESGKFTKTLHNSYSSFSDWIKTLSISTGAGGVAGTIYGVANGYDSLETAASALALGFVGLLGGGLYAELRQRLAHRSLKKNYPALHDKAALNRILNQYVDYGTK